MDKTTLQLFGRFPRELSAPNRWLAYSLEDMEHFIRCNNGILYHLYAAIYPSNYLIDKIFFDLDYGPDVLGDAKKLYKWALDQKYGAVPLVSGKKGYHIYIITKPKIYGPQAKLLLTKATFSIIKSVFGSFKQEIYTDSNGKQVQVLRNSERIIGPDPMICGDIRRVGRIPNTLRPPNNVNYCTYLPPDEFLEMTEADVAKHMKSVHSYDYNLQFKTAPLLTDFEYDFEGEREYSEWKALPVNSSELIIGNPNDFLKGLLRPCLYNNIISIHPSHEVRLAATLDLFELDYAPKEILDIYSKLGWEDFEEKKCLEQIKSCKAYKPFSCTKLRSYGIPKVCCIGGLFV